MSLPVFILPDGALESSEAGQHTVLAGSEATHATGAKRLGAGQRLELVDGGGTRATAVIIAVDKHALEARIERIEREERPPVEFVLVQALAKQGRDEQAVETATETGAMGFIPWQAERSISRWQGAKITKGTAKWQNIARAATKQSRRAYLPAVENPVTSRQLAHLIEREIEAGGDAVVLHENAHVLPHRLPVDKWRGRVLIIVGPEGGITPAEEEMFNAAGATSVRISPHVLRTSTAGPVAIAALNLALLAAAQNNG